MLFKPPLFKAKLVRRYKRFLADVQLETGEEVTVHTANTGSMMGCSEPGSLIWLSDSENPKRKYLYSWEITETEDGVLVGINTWLANRLVREAIENGVVVELDGYKNIRQEVPYGRERSRIDLLLENPELEKKCYVEVKNVTAVVNKTAIFPDAVSTRGAKHLRELMSMINDNHRAVLVFCVQRKDANSVRPADEIDPAYGKALRDAVDHGVEVFAYRTNVTPLEITLKKRLPLILS